jgi:hypothetical protein
MSAAPPKTAQPNGGVYTFGELVSANLQPPVCVVEGLLYECRDGLLAGRFSIGKTFLGLQLAICLALGRDFLGRKVTRPYKVAFIDTENGAAEIRHRLVTQTNALGLSPDERQLLDQNFVYIDCDMPGELQHVRLNGAGYASLETFVKRLAVEILIFDNFGKVFPGDEKDEERIKAVLANLGILRLKCPSLQRGLMLFLHHLTKPFGESCSLLTNPYEFLSKMRGSGRLLDFFPTRLALADEIDSKGEAYFILNGFIRSGVVSPLLLQRNDDSMLFTLHDDKGLVLDKVFGGADRKKEIFRLIQSQLPPTFTFQEAAALKDSVGNGFSRPTVSDTLRIAVTNGLLGKAPSGAYTKIP